MTMIARDDDVVTGDAEAIVALQDAFDRQRRAFLADPYPSLDERRGHLEALAGMMMANRDRIRQAMSDDFAVHPALFSRPDRVPRHRRSRGLRHQPARAVDGRRGARDRPGVVRVPPGPSSATQPKGVIGNIVPWNFPFDLGVGPLVEMLAAGNRVIVKSVRLHAGVRRAAPAT